jgi:hypothetical protein
MFSKFRKYMVLAVVAVASLAIVGQAAASTATVSPGGAVTGTSGASQLTLNTAAKTLNCTTSGATATLASATGTLPLTISSNLVPLFGSSFGGGRCTVTGGIGITVACGNSTLKVTGLTSGGVTAGSITGISCTITVTGSSCRNVVAGGVVGSFDNATSILTVATTGQTLAATGSTCTTLPNDASASFTDSTRAALRYAIAPTTTVNVV